MRRLPVYLLLDCSESMAGPGIEAVEKGVAMLVRELQRNPHALESVYLSIITFSRQASQLLPLTELAEVRAPRLTIKPGTALGAGLRLLSQRMVEELTPTTPGSKGDYRPLVFLMTDGQPTDDWATAARELRERGRVSTAAIYAIGCGEDVDYAVLSAITDTVFKMPELSPESLSALFVWLTASVQTASQGVGAGGAADLFDGPLSSSLLEKVRPGPTQKAAAQPRQVFLHALCLRESKPYLMRFILDPRDGRYHAAASHALAGLEKGDADALPPIQSTALAGCPPCPWCEAEGAGVCGCGTVFCIPAGTSALFCPACGVDLDRGEQTEFSIARSAG